MTQPNRLPSGGRIDRSKPVGFVFNGRSLWGYRGDTLASALLANGARVVGRSFKYHRPRGIVGSASEEPNAIVQLGSGATTLPNYLATQVELYEGLTAESVNCWPSVGFDLRAVTGLFSRFMPPGFYYKTFMWPRTMWMAYERRIRGAGGYGVAPSAPDPDRYDKTNAHCDVLVVGGGPAGLSAALEAGRAGARVILADEQAELGGSLLGSREVIDGAPATEWVAAAIAELGRMDEVRLLPRSTVIGYYDHNFVTIAERVTDHLPPGTDPRPRQRIWRVRAAQVVIAAGAIERPLVFPNNDRPGVMLASAVSTYVNRYGVAPGSRAAVFTNNDGAYRTALDLARAGVPTVVVDMRHDPGGELPARARAEGVETISGHAVVDVRSSRGVKGVEIARLNTAGDGVEGGSRRLTCDLLAVSGGWNPTVHLHAQSGGKARYDEAKGRFVPGAPVQAERSAGSCNGSFSLGECLAEGMAAGAAAAGAAGHGDGAPTTATPETHSAVEESAKPVWVVPSRKPSGSKSFVDPQTDASVADVAVAVSEGYESIEHVKRYTTLGMGSDQGKLVGVNGIGLLAQTLGVDISSVGTTTFRPPYTPATFGAIAGRDLGELFDPVRKTAIYEWHREDGAIFENVGQWKRPWYYPRGGESMHDAVTRECLAVRNGVGVMDASTLGKIDVRGPDSSVFLNRVYTNGWTQLAIGRCRYGFMLKEDGMLMDDGVTARLADDHYLMHTTTGGTAGVMAWLERWLQTEWPDLRVYLTSVTDHWTTVSINGPDCRKVVSRLSDDIDYDRDAFPFLSFREGAVAGVPARVIRVSFVGELSYEVNVSANYGRHVWESVMDAGRDYGITAFGTEAMHMLRAEKGYVIAGQDTDGSMTPADLGMGWIISKRKKDFLGKRSLSREDTAREGRKQLVGLLPDDSTEVLPEGAQVVDWPGNGTPVPMLGHVTSSYMSPTLGRSFALGYVKGGHSRMDDKVFVAVAGGRTVPATIAGTQFYDPEGERQNV